MNEMRIGWSGLVLALGLLLSACGGKSEADLLAAAKTFIDKRDYKSATIELKSMLQKTPGSGEGRFLLGKALLESGDVAGAEAEFGRALENKYSEEAVAPLLAKALYGQRQYRKLVDRYASFEVADYQGAVDLKLALGMSYAALGQKDLARQAVDRAISLKPDLPEVHIADARLKTMDGNIDGALATLDAMLAKSPGAALGWQFKGDLLAQGKGDTNAATVAYRKALEARSDLPEAHAALISLAFARRDIDGASAQLEALKKFLPNHPQTRFFEAQIAFGKNEFAKARELLQPLQRALPDHPGVLHLAGATEFKLNAFTQAETLLTKAVSLSPDFAGARRMLAQVYLRQRQPAKVLSTLKPMLDKGTADSESLSLMAQAAAMQGDTKVADEYFAKAAKLKPDDKRIQAAQALGQMSRGNSEAAAVQLESLAADDKGTSVDLALITAHLRRNEFDKALKAIDALEKKQPTSPVPPNLRGFVELRKKDTVAARKSFELALSRDPKFLASASALAALDLADKRPDDAKGRFEAVLKADPKNASAMLGLAELLQRSGGTPEQVAKRIGEAITADPTNLTARLALIDHHARARDYKSALAAAQAALGALPDHADIVERQARVQMAAGETQQALTSLNRLTQLRPEIAASFIALAEGQLVANDLDGASRSARRALELAPSSLATQRLAISVAMKQKRPKDALALARDIQTRQPNDPIGFLAEGEIELDQKNFDGAVAAFRKATTKAAPAQAPTRLHHALVQAKREAEAAKFAETWLAGHPKDSLFQFYLGDVALNQGDKALAERRYSEVLKVQPEHALALNNVAWLMVQQKRPGAVALAERAVKAAPNQAPLLDTLALALAAESQLPKAIEVQKKVVELAPDSPSFRLNLAKMQLQSGDKSGAKVELEKLVKLGAKYPAQAEVADLLKAAGG
ncbi:XrtA/PEP-CTERM system TPR-repeat protein PrsT [Ideonella sp. A 288]|uniref:XrtA/PEP-CTERM system TPR-repeat protein PrsT n=1 Tax=Ideonella sp. A 288 TaxID=1962181 RepID=UPI000B4B002A|nr:XrtA/PEP-CTERM system TPR-repeat protein PrsT [Ideonella sp. A 288]